MKFSEDYHQLWPIDVAKGVGVVYQISVTHADTNRAKQYVVHSSLVTEALRRCALEDYTFCRLTERSDKVGGTIRRYELHPWVTKTGQFGLLPILCPLIGNTLSEESYEDKALQIARSRGKWVRWGTVGDKYQLLKLPPDAIDFGPPQWPKVLLEGDWATIISRAFDNRWIKSLSDKTARSLAGLE